MRCLNTFYAHFQRGAVVETLEKKQRNAAEFLGSILHHANLFSMLWVRAAIGIRLDGPVTSNCKYAAGITEITLQPILREFQPKN